MTPQMIMTIAQLALKYGLPAAQKMFALFRSENVTDQQMDDWFKTAQKGYDDYIAEARAKKGQTQPSP